MGRFKDINWNLPETPNGSIATWDAVKVAVLMDIRDELKALNSILSCKNALDIPVLLRQIQRNTKPVSKSTKRRSA
jgi:hypothetical protein